MPEQHEGTPREPHPDLTFKLNAFWRVRYQPPNPERAFLIHDELYGIARWLRDESKYWRQRRSTVAKGCAAEYRAAECRCAAASMLHSFLTLEAYVNAWGAAGAMSANAEISTEDASALAGYVPVETKWLLLPLLFTGRRVFDRAAEPFRSFDRLRTFRNSLVHAKLKTDRAPTTVVPQKDGTREFVVHPLAGTERTILDHLKGMNSDARGAERACEIVKEMVRAVRAVKDAKIKAPPLQCSDWTI
jgi:hypothetical protein